MEPGNHPHIEILALSALSPNPRNARKHPDKQVAQLAANIERFGFPVPIIVDERNMIIAGHGRYQAADKLSLDEVPVIRMSNLSEAEKRAFVLADNRLAELSDWDPEILGAELTALFEGGFDISEIGFSTADLDFAIVDEPPPHGRGLQKRSSCLTRPAPRLRSQAISGS